jgi:acetyltransferase-like isoleucine patch superfamily enzyme
MSMLNNFFKIIYRFICIKLLFNWLNNKIKIYFNFIIPNLRFLISKRIICDKNPICNQKTFFTGAGKIEIGDNCFFGYKLGGFHRGGSIEIQPRYKDSYIKIGNNIRTNNNIFFCAANYIEIGDNGYIGEHVTIFDYEAHAVDPYNRNDLGEIGKVIIGKNVWLGNNVTILKNSEIGENSIVGAGAVVAGKFPANVIIGGIPAKVIKNL